MVKNINWDFGKRNVRLEVRVKRKYFIPLVSVFFVTMILLSFLVIKMQITGRAVIELNSVRYTNETISGKFNLIVNSGELFPADAFVKLKLNNQEVNIPVSQLTSLEKANGEYYVEKTSLSGEGEGYGLVGKRKIYPEIFFKFLVYQTALSDDSGENGAETPESQTESNQTETPVAETPAETPTTLPTETSAPEAPVETPAVEVPTAQPAEAPSEVPVETPVPEAPVETPSETPALTPTGQLVKKMTGKIVGEIIEEKEGEVSAENQFEYSLNTNEQIEIVSDSVRTETRNLSANELDIEQSGSRAVVTTEYYEEEEGYGSEYSGEEKETIEIDIEQFGLKAEEGTLEASLVYENLTILEARKTISIIPAGENTTSEIIENITNTAPVLLQNIPDIILPKNSSFTLNLSEYFYDKENDSLSFSASNVEEVNIIIENNMVSVAPETSFNGEKNISFMASDGELTTESNIAKIKVEDVNKTETTVQYGAVIGKPVRWKKKIVSSEETNMSVELPKDAENISVVKIENENKEVLSESVSIIGQVIRLFSRDNLKTGITGKIVEEENITEEASGENITLEINELVKEVEIEYYTQAPIAIEENTSSGKNIVVSGPDTVHYEDVLAYTFLPSEVSSEKSIKLYWINESGNNTEKQEVNFTAYDTDENNKIDYIEWIVPHLSSQSYELILITKAIHLDSNKTFIANVYDYVKERDDSWVSVGNNEYLRVTFERNLCFLMTFVTTPKIAY